MSGRAGIITAFALIGVLLVTFGFWVSGFNFDERGPAALGWFLLSCVAVFFGVGLGSIFAEEQKGGMR